MSSAVDQLETKPEPGKKPQRLKILLTMLDFIKPYKLQVIGASVALVFTATVTLSLGQGLRLLVDKGFSSGNGDTLNTAVIVFLFLVLLLAIGTFTRFYLVSWIGERVTADLRRAVYDHVIGLHPYFFESRHSGEIQNRLTADTTLLQTVIGSSVSIALRNALMFIGGLIWLLITNAKLTVIVLGCVPLVIIPIMFFGRRVRRLSKSSQDKLAHAGAFVAESLKNVKIVQAFNHQQRDRQLFAGHVEDTFEVSINRIRQRSMLTAAVILLVLGAIGLMLWVGGHDVIEGRITGGELAAFVFYAIIVAGSVGAISEVYGDLQRAAGATERLLELLQSENRIAAPKNTTALPEKIHGSISFENVTFAYPSRPDVPAIRDLSLVVNAGESVALVGASGAGKSTLFDLILRFYDPQQGAVDFENIPLTELDPEQFRSHIALVPQQPTLFTTTIRENIRYGRPDASDEEVEQAAVAAFADEFIQLLPGKYDAEVGEGGVRLSGGQRQRIAIARAILCDPEVLLLDEATSALDADSEHKVQQALEKLMVGRTTLVIAHRLATVTNVNRILVLDHGELVASGKHEELVEKSTLYARWAQLQFDLERKQIPAG